MLAQLLRMGTDVTEDIAYGLIVALVYLTAGRPSHLTGSEKASRMNGGSLGFGVLYGLRWPHLWFFGPARLGVRKSQEGKLPNLGAVPIPAKNPDTLSPLIEQF